MGTKIHAGTPSNQIGKNLGIIHRADPTNPRQSMSSQLRQGITTLQFHKMSQPPKTCSTAVPAVRCWGSVIAPE
ncbi:MAG TPA: hypothetical protein DDX19_22340 [Rhodopirellula baltica]|uniref:Uncharacterized protein n=1 Tax=Rhodopirellula baltica (strain DSM 10527 / NCIMB 13988 / SH1) TaxID=243090 RepID=Q7UFI5_RHOBA|nr:hypothetical protein RB8535 [Rhodopirellula baltica SH 1]HBE65441.1 hypothetical protein [Rhodopirellula baltica]